MLSETVDKFRLEVLGGGFAAAERTLEQVRIDVDAAWIAAESKETRDEIAAMVTNLLDWARQTVLVSRSQAQGKLILLTRERAYTESARRY